MTLKEQKSKVLRMIEEISPSNSLLTDDPDIAEKINDVINQIQNELARIKKIPAKKTLEVTKGQEISLKDIAKDIFQLNIIREVENTPIGDTIIFNSSGVANIYYYRYPKQITKETNDEDYEFELTTDCLEIMPYGVAGDLLKSDISANYGRIYSDRYESMLQRLDPRYHTGSIFIGSDVDEFL